ncbi:MAG: 16S rRNA (guanine(527)-N(7))-methyltransferase RsmG [Chitinispirillales bacterium]|jgi:16S rRNA (guanine527-N7)-methyltransferase|nr:16S rRNA (guanine(527)-N(7))-methyltransferase RsmG [Chitinispirillales bacterium]
MSQKEFFRQFLSEHFPGSLETLFGQFERFYLWLTAENQKINLISRQTDPADIWTIHFLDSLLPVKYVDFHGRAVLDFGTGGGLPGIPLSIVFGSAEVTLLDSKKKKIAAVRNAAAHLGLGNCRFLDERIENIGNNAAFDIIVSRSVRIEPAYKSTLLKLLKPHGKLILYKSKILDDVRQFANVEIFDVEIPLIGERKIVIVGK